METVKKVDDKNVIGTHDGTFHCDEVLACALLRILPEYSNAIIKRSRDQTILAACDVVVDVGAQFDPDNHRYDHHQRYKILKHSSDFVMTPTSYQVFPGDVFKSKE